ncbi:ATP-dependent Clp protease ATP-binding subunit ClpX [Bifidobacterium magnum]|uniref:ATP-dependent Clp protease ATP-binding subunit ClpX n=1 Tax=Bifidobacterium magnum TaxID=1692 RepID=UPI0003B410D2|nr:ATP-dependent Clp protease ATP-binding subunit ClpX [Bifidobacterium magnum]
MGRVISYNDGMQHCAFCGKSEHEVRKLVAGAGVAICDSCIALCVDIVVQEDRPEEYVDEQRPLATPMQIFEALNRRVVGQEEAKRTLSVAVYNHFKRVRMEESDNSKFRDLQQRLERNGYRDSARDSEDVATHDDLEQVSVAKSNILLLGPTGVGKTYLAQTLARIMDVPFVITDATTLTQAGYVGDDVETMLQRLLAAADGDIERAQHGIIYIDEIDKIARKSGENTSLTRDVSGEGVQQALLKILEGCVASVPVEGSRKHKELETVSIDTKDILFICAGAFVGLDQIVARRCGTRESGFSASWKTQPIDERELLNQVTADDLTEFGLLSEFVGRLPVMSALHELTRDDLVRILTQPDNALVKQYRKLFAMDGVDLLFTDEAVEAIAELSIERRTGARGLRSIIERILEDVMFQLPSLSDAAEVIVDEDAVRGRHAVQIIYDDHQPSLSVISGRPQFSLGLRKNARSQGLHSA